MSVCVLVECL